MKQIKQRANGTTQVVTVNDLPSMTDQSFKKEADVNHIISKYLRTGQLNHVAQTSGYYADVSETKNLHEGLIDLDNAKQSFYALPKEIVKRFKNPSALLEFLDDPANKLEAEALGLKSRAKSADKAKEPVAKADTHDSKDESITA